ncbi:hypothetical protein KIMH_02700 [Bombiscardovia apis]|uniref:Uncharacterized protein n=1 Tax=Bombiscardovia apis TaxID=2932182 RepID=A0ABN6SEP5_9BIFI|nr:hypothetical protein [Bombiscardovia apis]BDR54159.1 hypothetical protein KIMH_02700 [Bombiscardovia apis]
MARRQRPKVKPQTISQASSGVQESDSYFKFSFRYMDEKILKSNESKEFEAFVRRLIMLSDRSIQKLKLDPKHGLGFERISDTSVRCSVPSGLDVESVGQFLSFRYGQGKKAMLGKRVADVLYVLCFEHAFGDAYEHGGS